MGDGTPPWASRERPRGPGPRRLAAIAVVVLATLAEERVAGRWFGRAGDRPGGIQWDAYYLFDRGARWDEEPSKLLGWGRTVIGKSDDLKQEIAPYLG